MWFRPGWSPLERLSFSFAGQNLLNRTHQEFADTFVNVASQVRRSAYAKVSWQF